MRKCDRCEQAGEFYAPPSWNGRVDNVCVSCRREQARQKAKRYTEADPDWWKKKWYAIPAEKRTLYSRRYKYKGYGISLEIFHEMVRKQEGRCLICNHLPPTDAGANKSILHVDHCHVTGKVRGLLCHSCNVTIGLAKENPEILEKAADYLRKFNKES